MESVYSIILSGIKVPNRTAELSYIKLTSDSIESSLDIDLQSLKIMSKDPIELRQHNNSGFVIKVPYPYEAINFYYKSIADSSTSNETEKIHLVKTSEKNDKTEKYFSSIDKNGNRFIQIKLNDSEIGILNFRSIHIKSLVSNFTFYRNEPTTTASIIPHENIAQKQETISTFPEPQSIVNPFPISMEDGPIFRESISDYESRIPKLKQLMKTVNDNLSHYETLYSQITTSRSSLVASFGEIDSVVSSFYGCKFDSSLISSLESLSDENISAIRHLKANIMPSSKLLNVEASMAIKKRTFEEESKKYYDWLSKLLSSGKSKDEKFLLKRKAFELSKVDYFNFLFDTIVSVIYSLTSLDCEFMKNYKACKAKRQRTRSNIESAVALSELNTELAKITISTPFSSAKKSGILFTQGGQGKSGWHKQWVVLKNGKLSEYMDWRKGTSRRNDPIDISLSSIKPLDVVDKRRNCFRIITSTGIEHYFQATSEEDRDSWIQTLYDAGQLISFSKKDDKKSSATDNHRSNDSATVAARHAEHIPSYNCSQSVSSYNHPQKLRVDTSFGNSNKSLEMITPEEARKRRVSSVSFDNLRMVQRADKSNNFCSDCGSGDSVEWISLNLLIVFCVKCSSCHRSLGTSISKVRSLKLDIFSKETFKLIQSINNRASNMLYEELLDPDDKIPSDASDEERLRFITNKYSMKKYVDSSTGPKPDLLIHGVSSRNIGEILQSIALGTDPNFTVSRNIPSPTSDTPGKTIHFSLLEFALSQGSKLQNSEAEQSEFVFDLAELLILNGADTGDHVENHISLPKEATNYWQLKINRLNGSVGALSSASTSVPPLSIPTATKTRTSPIAILGGPNGISSPISSKSSGKEYKFNLLKKKIKN